jgi:hypothetical protein
MTLMLKKLQPEMAVEFLALGPGIEVLKSNQRSSPQFGQQLQAMRDAGIAITVCEQSMENLGLTADQMFEAKPVRGGQEVARRLAEGYHVLTF